MELLETEPEIDLVLTDLRLPDGSGLDLLKKIKERWSSPAVVLVTAQGNEQIAVAALKAGAADYLVKQSDYLHRLPVVISNAVAQNRLLREQAALQRAEIRYQSLVEQTPAVVFLDAVDDAETTLYISPRIEELTGYTPACWRSGRSGAGTEFMPKELDFLTSLARQAAVAIENARLYDETQRRLRELETINRISSSLRVTYSVNEMLPILLNETLELLNTPHGSIWLYDQASDMLVQRIATGAQSKIEHRSLRFSEGIIGHTFTTGKRYISPELKNDPLLFEQNRESMTPGLSGVCIPIQSTAGPVGVLMVALETGRQILEEVHLLTILSEITGNAIHRAELYQQSQEQVRRLTTLHDIDSAIASSFDLRPTLSILMDQTLTHLGVDAVDIALCHPDLQSLTYLIGGGFRTPSPTRPQLRIGEGLAGQVIISQQTYHLNDIQASPATHKEPLIRREGFVAYKGIPLIVKGQIKGVFEVFHRSLLYPTLDWMEFLQTLAGQAAIAIDNAQLFENLQHSIRN